jgi:hypothetical protein
MTLKGGDRVAFDFDGSLEVARLLWALADQTEQGGRNRTTASHTARTGWEGKYGDDFDARIGDEETSTANVASRLREEAKGWATAWKKAMDEQNKRNRAAKVTEVRNKRSWMERNIGDRFWGDDSEDQVAAANTVSTPKPPLFAPTAREQRF